MAILRQAHPKALLFSIDDINPVSVVEGVVVFQWERSRYGIAVDDAPLKRVAGAGSQHVIGFVDIGLAAGPVKMDRTGAVVRPEFLLGIAINDNAPVPSCDVDPSAHDLEGGILGLGGIDADVYRHVGHASVSSFFASGREAENEDQT